MSRGRVLYLPVETKARELLGRSFLAARAVERGWMVIMGSGLEVRRYMRDRPPGVFAVASVPESKAERLQEMRKVGHQVANLCEESLVYWNDHYYCEQKLSPKALNWVNRLLVVGSENAEHVRRYRPSHADKIAITGNPRFDITLPQLRGVYEQEVKRIQAQFGRFILVNTNFSKANPFDIGSDPVAVLMRNGMVSSDEHAAFLYRSIDYKRRQMIGLQAMLNQLAESPLIEKIIIRPHPVENHDAWRRWVSSSKIEVVYEGDANVWMLAAEAVLHPGCTTGVEGLLLDRPVYSYVPEPGIEFLNQADAVSYNVACADEFLKNLCEVRCLDQAGLRASFADQRKRLGCLVANVDLPFAADRILDELDQLDLPSVKPDEIGLGTSAQQPKPAHNPTARQRQKLPNLLPKDIQLPTTYWIHSGALQNEPRLTALNDRLIALH